jgi:hypothetical protein
VPGVEGIVVLAIALSEADRLSCTALSRACLGNVITLAGHAHSAQRVIAKSIFVVHNSKDIVSVSKAIRCSVRFSSRREQCVRDSVLVDGGVAINGRSIQPSSVDDRS